MELNRHGEVVELTGENEDGSIVYWERRNGSGATVAGVNFEGKIGIPHRFELQLGYTLQSSRYDTPERWSDQLAPQRKMFRAPDHYGYLTSLFDITPRFKASLFGTYTGSMLVKHILSDGTNETDLEQNTPSFWDMGIKLAYTFRIGKAVNRSQKHFRCLPERPRLRSVQRRRLRLRPFPAEDVFRRYKILHLSHIPEYSSAPHTEIRPVSKNTFSYFPRQRNRNDTQIQKAPELSSSGAVVTLRFI